MTILAIADAITAVTTKDIMAGLPTAVAMFTQLRTAVNYKYPKPSPVNKSSVFL